MNKIIGGVCLVFCLSVFGVPRAFASHEISTQDFLESGVEKNLFTLLTFVAVLEPEIAQIIEISDEVRHEFSVAHLLYGDGAAIVGMILLHAIQAKSGSSLEMSQKSGDWLGVKTEQWLRSIFKTEFRWVREFFEVLGQGPRFSIERLGLYSSSGVSVASTTSAVLAQSDPQMLPYFRTNLGLGVAGYDQHLDAHLRTIAQELKLYFNLDEVQRLQVLAWLRQEAARLAIENRFDSRQAYRVDLVQIFSRLTREDGSPFYSPEELTAFVEWAQVFYFIDPDGTSSHPWYRNLEGENKDRAAKNFLSSQDKIKMIEKVLGAIDRFSDDGRISDLRRTRAQMLATRIRLNLTRLNLLK